MGKLRQKMENDLRLGGYSLSTRDNYLRSGQKLADHFNCSPQRLDLSQVQQFLLRHAGEWQLEEEMRRTPAQGAFDGFYAARLVKIEAVREDLPVAA